MILPGTENFEGVIGTTWDQVVILYPATYSYVEWASKKEPNWAVTKTYKINNGVLGSDGEAYVALKESTGVNPVGDLTGTWQKLVPINNTGFTGEFFCGQIKLEVGTGITLGGANGRVNLKAKPTQTASMVVGNVHFGLLLKDTEENLYEYVEGKIKWKEK